MLKKFGVFIVAAKRTPFGAFGGKLKDFTCTDLATEASKSALSSIKLDPKHVDSAFFGNVCQTHVDTAYLARHAALKSGVSESSPCLTVNRLCGSGFQAVIEAVQDILLGRSQICLAGGAESMSGAPHIVRGVRFGTKLGVDSKLEDSLWHTLIDYNIRTPMGVTAENLAEQYGISREECDAFALHSQTAYAAALSRGNFSAEIAEISLPGKKSGAAVMQHDEHPRADATLEKLASLPTVFKKANEGGVVTAGNSSGICDGAAALLVASEAAVAQHGLQPLARVSGWGVAGCEPRIMGIGPVPAIRRLVETDTPDLSLPPGNSDDKFRLNVDALEFVEVNEAFAAQYLAVERELGLDRARTNQCGGAIAIGHPVGASGARITAHLAHRLAAESRGGGGGGQKKRALASACIGGGQGIALLLESV